MSLESCRRCGGTGQYADTNPVTGQHDWCAGCEGDGKVEVKDPLALCKRCSGSGVNTDPNPTVPYRSDWCLACKGTGYAS